MKRWIIVAALVAVSMWTANLTLYNWWAAGGPPTPNPQVYETRGNTFAAVTLLLFTGAVVIALQRGPLLRGFARFRALVTREMHVQRCEESDAGRSA